MGSEATKTDQEPYKVVFTTKELKERLSPQEYYVTQEKGTERCVIQYALAPKSTFVVTY